MAKHVRLCFALPLDHECKEHMKMWSVKHNTIVFGNSPLSISFQGNLIIFHRVACLVAQVAEKSECWAACLAQVVKGGPDQAWIKDMRNCRFSSGKIKAKDRRNCGFVSDKDKPKDRRNCGC